MKTIKDLTHDQAKMLANKNGLRYVKRDRVLKNSTGSFELRLDDERAYSYRWWTFFIKFNGVYLFNNVSYSNSTSQHQSSLCSLIYDINALPGFNVEYNTFNTRTSLDLNRIADAISYEANSVLKSCKEFLEAPRKHNKTRATTLYSLIKCRDHFVSLMDLAKIDCTNFVFEVDQVTNKHKHIMKYHPEYQAMQDQLKADQVESEVKEWLK